MSAETALFRAPFIFSPPDFFFVAVNSMAAQLAACGARNVCTPLVLVRGYLCLRVPMYHDTVAKQWPPSSKSGSSSIPVAYEALTPNQQKVLIDCKERLDEFHAGLGEQSIAARTLLCDFAWFDRAGFDWHPWHALKAAGIQSPQVFAALANSVPFGSGVFDHKSGLDLEQEFADMATSAQQQARDSVYLDYFNGVGLKLSIPCNLQLSVPDKLDSEIGYGRYDDRNSPSLAHRMGVLLRKTLPPANDQAVTPENASLAANALAGKGGDKAVLARCVVS